MNKNKLYILIDNILSGLLFLSVVAFFITLLRLVAFNTATTFSNIVLVISAIFSIVLLLWANIKET